MDSIPSPPDSFPLSEAQRQRAYLVSRIDLPQTEALRVQVMGICVGRPLHVVRGGDPLIVHASGANIVISRGLAAAIKVHPPHPVQVNSGPAF